MKYITVTLTEDQAHDLIGLIEGWLPSAQWFSEQGEQRVKWDEEYRSHKAHTDYKIAFRKRTLTKLAQALVTMHSQE